MSLSELIGKLENEGKLFRFVPKGPNPARRCLFLTAAAKKDFDDINSATNLLTGRGYIEAALTKWTKGEFIYAKNAKNGGFLKELDPPPSDIWEIRVTEPTVKARLFGTFVEQDNLLLTRFFTRPHLGKKDSQAWSLAMNDCASQWASMFNVPPFRADTIDKYVSENCEAFELKR